jgi:MoaA/NifB/PqqE/SkfB family radical SAM enzyme
MIKMIEQQVTEFKYACQVSRLTPKCTFPPQFVYIEPTNACVLKCKMCMRSRTETRKVGYMKFDLYTKVIDDISSRVHNIGLLKQGEPLLHPRFVDMVKYAKEKGLNVGFNTNAVLLDEEKSRELLECGLDWIYFSFDGANKKVYEEIRKGAIYEEVKQNILQFIELRNEKKSKKPYMSMYIIETSETRDYLNEFLEYWKNKVDFVGINKLMNFFDSVDDDELRWYREIREQNYPLTSYPVCTFPWFTTSVNWDGTVEHCLADFRGLNIVGDARKENVLDIWNNAQSIAFREAALKRDFSRLSCGNCSSLWTQKDQIPPRLMGYFFSKLLFLRKLVKKQGNNHYWQEKIWGEYFEWDTLNKKWKIRNVHSLFSEK